MMILNKQEAREQAKKKMKLLNGLDRTKEERDQIKTYIKDAKMAEKPPNYFPFTHGDHIERQREIMKAELKEEFVNMGTRYDSRSVVSQARYNSASDAPPCDRD